MRQQQIDAVGLLGGLLVAVIVLIAISIALLGPEGTSAKVLIAVWLWSLPVVLPILIVSIAMAGGAAFSDDPGPLIAALGVVNLCLTVFVMIFALAISLLVPPLWVLLAEGESFQKLINPKHAWALFRANAGGFLVALLISWLASSVLGILGTALCFIGVLPAAVIGQLFMAHLVGQAIAQARENLANLPAIPAE